jgi:hypothetical protein
MILDHTENLTLISDDEDYLFDAQMTLARLSQGLFWLYNSVAQAEYIARQAAAKDNVLIGIVNGVIKDVPTDWLSCAFQWYAVSVYNYVRLVGWLSTKDTVFTNEYVKRVIPKVTEYRHKVAAHFAITAPRKDNQADLIASIMTNIIYAHGYLRAGAMSEILTDENGKEIMASNKTSWSLTKTHNALRSRYWPNGPLEAFQSFRISAGATRKIKIDWED